MAKRNHKKKTSTSLKNLTPELVEEHENEKFTRIACAFRTQIAQLLAPGTGSVPECLKRLDVRDLVKVYNFLHGHAEPYFERYGLMYAPQAMLWERMSLAREEHRLHESVVADRWAGYAENGIEADCIQIPDWFALL